MDSAAMLSIRQGDPDRVNYHTRYPIAEGVWDYFSQDIVRAIDIRIQTTPIARAIEPTLEPPPTEDRVGWAGS
jgi:hypothetical protein